MKEASKVNHINLAILVRQEIFIEDASGTEFTLEAVFVSEKLITELEEWSFNIGPNQIGGNSGVVGHLAQVLSETAPKVEQGLSIAKTIDDGVIDWRQMNAKI
jgi:hypothetical protein